MSFAKGDRVIWTVPPIVDGGMPTKVDAVVIAPTDKLCLIRVTSGVTKGFQRWVPPSQLTYASQPTEVSR